MRRQGGPVVGGGRGRDEGGRRNGGEEAEDVLGKFTTALATGLNLSWLLSPIPLLHPPDLFPFPCNL